MEGKFERMNGGSIRLRPIQKQPSYSSYNNNKNMLMIVMFLMAVSSDLSAVADGHHGQLKGGGGGRGLKRFKAAVENTTGTTLTFDCSPSGPCIPCLYHEKKLETYRCSETGYRIPFKCVKPTASPLDNQDNNNHHHNLLEHSSSTIEVGSEVYITYRSCIPAVNQEKLSLLAFEAIMLLLLVSSSFVIFRRKGTLIMPGAIRVPTNPRF